MKDIKELDKQINFIEGLYSRYLSALKDRSYNSFSDCNFLNASGRNSYTHIRNLGILIRKETKKLEEDLFRNGYSFKWGSLCVLQFLWF